MKSEVKLTWRRRGTDWVSGQWLIQRLFSNNFDHYEWYVATPIDGGYHDSLAEAKAYCQRAHEKSMK